jgi:hypothetical protein
LKVADLTGYLELANVLNQTPYVCQLWVFDNFTDLRMNGIMPMFGLQLSF